MSIIRDFVTKPPAACGVPAGLAEIYGELNGKLFDFELANPDGPLHRKHFDSVWSRISLGFKPWADLADESGAVAFAQSLLLFAARTIDAGGGDWRGKWQEEERLKTSAASNPSTALIQSLLPISLASTLGSWA